MATAPVSPDQSQQMTPQDFAARVRAKYPGAYDGMGDDELTQKVVAKYPQYQSQIKQADQQAKPSMGGQLLNAVKNSNVVQGAKQLASDIPQIPQRTAANLKDAMTNWPEQRPQLWNGERTDSSYLFPGQTKSVAAEPVSPLATSVSFAGSTAGMLPTAAKTGRLFDQVEGSARAAGQTVDVDATLSGIAKRAAELQKAGHEMPGVLRAFIQRMSPTPGFIANDSAKFTGAGRLAAKIRGPIQDAQPLTFQEARDMFSKATNLTAQERMNMGGKMPAVLKQFTAALDAKIRQAASDVGEGENYAKAMSDYPWVKRGQALKDAVKDYGVSTLKTAGRVLPWYLGWRGAKDLFGGGGF
jgi:hypothetical protein